MQAINKRKYIFALLLLLACALLIPCAVMPAYASQTDLTVIYEANGGVGTTATEVYTEGTVVISAWPANIGISPQNGYHFTGWNTLANGTGTAYAAGESHTLSSALTLYAQWSNTGAAPFTASLCETNASTGTELTEGGAVGELWNYQSPNRILRIIVSGTGRQETLSITLPRGMAFVSGGWTEADGINATAVSFAAYDIDPATTGLQQGVSSYFNEYTGTLTYAIAAGASNSFSLNVLVAFDQNLWNNRGFFRLNNRYAPSENFYGCLTGEYPPITITMGGVSKAVSRIYSAECQYNYGVSINNITKTVPNNEAVIANLDARGLDGYWQSLIIEYTLPHLNGTYAEYVREGGINHLGGIVSYDSFTIDDSNPTKLVYAYTGLLRNFKSENFQIVPVLDFSDFADESVLEYSLTMTMVDHAGNTIVETGGTTVTVLEPKASIKAFTSIRSAVAQQTQGIYYLLGTLSVKNEGFIASDDVKIE